MWYECIIIYIQHIPKWRVRSMKYIIDVLTEYGLSFTLIMIYHIITYNFLCNVEYIYTYIYLNVMINMHTLYGIT